jgi:hypothetical protein
MPKYVFAYHQPTGYVPTSAEEVTSAWMAFFETMADHVVDPGQPVLDRRSIGEVGAGTQLAGYTVVEAGDLDAAVALAGGAPTIAHGGGVQVGVLGEIPVEAMIPRLRERAGQA